MPISPSDVKNVRQELRQTLAKFGKTLANAIHGPHSSKTAYSRQYIDRLERGKAPITPAIARGLQRIMAAQDDTDPDTATAQAMTVYATHDISGSLITGQVRQCGRPGCRIRFVPHHPRQLFHSAYCRVQAYKSGQSKMRKGK